MTDLKDFKAKYAQGDRNFSDRDFSHANLSYQLLSGSNFQSSNFSTANLSGAILIDCDFRNADLSFSNLSNANLTGANLTGTNLEGAAIATAVLKDALYNTVTTFPQGINPETLGAINLDAPPPEPAPIVEAESTPPPIEELAASPQTPQPTPRVEPDRSATPDSPSTPPPVPSEYRLTPIATPPPTEPPITPSPPPDSSTPKTPVSDWVNVPSAQTTTSAQPLSSNYTATPTPQTQPVKKSNNGIIALSALITLGIGYCMSRSFTPSSIGGFDEVANQFESVRFPRAACGDPMPTDPNDFPVNLYPVFIDYSAYNLQAVTQDYCTDAYRNTRANGTRAIQVASFTSRDRAQDFADFMRDRLGSGDIGQPNTFYR